MTRAGMEEPQADYRRAIDREIGAWLGEETEQLSEFYDMMRYQLGLVDENVAHAPTGGQMRPGPRRADARWISLLCLATCEAVGGSVRDAVRAAAAIELLASWFRIHRSIEQHDESPGRPSLWKLWGEPQAINTGDGMFPLAGRAILEAADDPEMVLTLARELADASLVHMEGQHMDLTFESRQDVTPGEYMQMLELCMGVLSGYSAWAGATIGGAGREAGRELRVFGSHLGVAWQIHQEIESGPDIGGTAPALLTEEHARLYLDQSLEALERAHLEPSRHDSLETFARQLVPLR
jgi:geranylgeranyl diphosphate synthase type I